MFVLTLFLNLYFRLQTMKDTTRVRLHDKLPFLPLAATQRNAKTRNDQNIKYLCILKVVCLFLVLHYPFARLDLPRTRNRCYQTWQVEALRHLAAFRFPLSDFLKVFPIPKSTTFSFYSLLWYAYCIKTQNQASHPGWYGSCGSFLSYS